MNDPIRFVILFDVARVSPNQRLNRWERNRRNQAGRLNAFNEWAHAGRPQVDCPVVVDVVIRRARALDHDNAVASLKPCLDGIFKDALTPDDSPRWLTLGEVRQETAKEWKGKEHVEFIVRPREE